MNLRSWSLAKRIAHFNNLQFYVSCWNVFFSYAVNDTCKLELKSLHEIPSCFYTCCKDFGLFDLDLLKGEVGTSSWGIYSYGPFHMAVQKQGGQLEPTYSSSVRIRGVDLGTYRKRWTIGRGGERGSGISVLMAQDYIYIYIYTFYIKKNFKITSLVSF